jgi:hypothetical protein
MKYTKPPVTVYNLVFPPLLKKNSSNQNIQSTATLKQSSNGIKSKKSAKCIQEAENY